MPLAYIGDATFIQSGPENWITTPFELDQLVVPFEGGLPDLAAFLASLTVGDPSTIDANMNLLRWQTSIPRPGVAQVELTYLGARDGVLPAVKHEQGNAVMSASSQRESTGIILTAPATVQYYGPNSVISYFSVDNPGTDVAPDPTGDPVVITYTFGDTTLSIGIAIQAVIDLLFMVQVIQTSQSEEVVAGKYWRNVSRKTKVLTPWVFSLPSGPHVSLAAAGTGYSVGDTISVSSGGESAVITVTAVGVLDSIRTWTESSDTFTSPHNFLPASGGTGSGAQFNVIIIP